MHDNAAAFSASPSAPSQLFESRVSPRLRAGAVNMLLRHLGESPAPSARLASIRQVAVTPSPGTALDSTPYHTPLDPISNERSASGIPNPGIAYNASPFAQIVSAIERAADEGSGASDDPSEQRLERTISILAAHLSQGFDVFAPGKSPDSDSDDEGYIISTGEQQGGPGKRTGHPPISGTDQLKNTSFYAAEHLWVLEASSRQLLDLDLYAQVLVASTVPSSLARTTFEKLLKDVHGAGGVAAPAPIFANSDIPTLPDNPSVSQQKKKLLTFLRVLEARTTPIFQPSPLASHEELKTFAGIDPATRRPYTSPQQQQGLR